MTAWGRYFLSNYSNTKYSNGSSVTSRLDPQGIFQCNRRVHAKFNVVGKNVFFIFGHFVYYYILNLYYHLNLPQDQIIWKWKKYKITFYWVMFKNFSFLSFNTWHTVLSENVLNFRHSGEKKHKKEHQTQSRSAEPYMYGSALPSSPEFKMKWMNHCGFCDRTNSEPHIKLWTGQNYVSTNVFCKKIDGRTVKYLVLTTTCVLTPSSHSTSTTLHLAASCMPPYLIVWYHTPFLTWHSLIAWLPILSSPSTVGSAMLHPRHHPSFCLIEIQLGTQTMPVSWHQILERDD